MIYDEKIQNQCKLMMCIMYKSIIQELLSWLLL